MPVQECKNNKKLAWLLSISQALLDICQLTSGPHTPQVLGPGSTHTSSKKASSTLGAVVAAWPQLTTPSRSTAPNSSSGSRQLQVLRCPSLTKSVLGSRTKSLLAAVSQCFSHSCYFPHWFRVRGHYTLNDQARVVLLLRNYRAKALPLAFGADTRVQQSFWFLWWYHYEIHI